MGRRGRREIIALFVLLFATLFQLTATFCYREGERFKGAFWEEDSGQKYTVGRRVRGNASDGEREIERNILMFNR